MNEMSSIKTVKTTCAYCGVGCGIKAEILDEEKHLIKIVGDSEHPANYGRLCSKGAALAETVSLENRLLTPVVEEKEVAWGVALDEVARRLKETLETYGPDAVAFYGSGQLLTEDYYVANKLMKGFIGSANMDTNSRLCMASTVAGQKRAFGADAVPGNYQDLELADLLVLVGSNTAWCHPVLFQRIRAEKEKRPELKIVVIDPRRTETCDIADLHLAIEPDSDVELFTGLLHYLIENKRVDNGFIDKHTTGYAQLSEAGSKCSLSQVADYCRVEREDLKRFYQWFSVHAKTVTSWSQGVNQSLSGTDKVNAIINCHLVTGRIGRPGSTPLSLTGQPNAMGGREVGGLANQLAAHMDFSDPDDIDRLARFWKSNSIARQPGLTAVDLFQAMADDKIKFVWIMATNPAASLPDTNNVRKALARCPNVIVSDCIKETDTLSFAHVKLPAAGWGEKDGTVTNSERRISRQRALLPLSGKARPDWWILCEVAKRLGYKDQFNYGNAVDIFREHAELSGFENNPKGKQRAFDISALANINQQDYDVLQPVQWPLTSSVEKGSERLFADSQFYTHDGKAQLVKPEKLFLQQTNNRHRHLPPLILNTGRVRDHWHTMTRTGLSERLGQHTDEPCVEMNSETAKTYRLEDQGFARIRTAQGSAIFRVKLSDTINNNQVFVPIHWTRTHSRTGLAGSLIAPEADVVSRQPGFKNNRAFIEPMMFSHQAVLMSRRKLNIDGFDYATMVRHNSCYRYELAGSEILKEQCQGLISADDDLLSYLNPMAKSYTTVAYSSKGLESFLFVSRSLPVVDRRWLADLFDSSQVFDTASWQMLAGNSLGGSDADKIVCSCMAIGQKAICQAIEESTRITATEVGKLTRAGTNCGSCIPEINQLIASASKERMQKAS